MQSGTVQSPPTNRLLTGGGLVACARDVDAGLWTTRFPGDDVFKIDGKWVCFLRVPEGIAIDPASAGVDGRNPGFCFT